MKPDLSIIIPCYNCQDTLEEAVESCFKQGISNLEIVLVDDGSNDSTRDIMRRLSDIHPEIKLFYHEKNQGGGATRNTAVLHTTSDIIFCLDSDDILPENTILRMLSFMKEKSCDGVLFEETRFFYNKDIKKTDIIKNNILNKPVEFTDLFNGLNGFLTKVNFLYTKKSFNNIRGYPTDHGFDTQTFGFNFLLNGNTVYVCPDTFYFHRRHKKPTSYFMREFSEGKLSFNSFLMYEDIIYLFSDDLIKEIFNYNLIENNNLGENNLGSFVSDYFLKKGEQNFFIKNYKDFLNKESFDFYMNGVSNIKRDDFSKKIIEAIYNYKNGFYDKSFEIYKDLTVINPNMRLLYINMLRCLLCKSGFTEKQSNDYVFQVFQPQKTKSKFLLLAERFDRLFKKYEKFKKKSL